MRNLAWGLVQWVVVLAMFTGLSCLVFPSVFSSRPSSGAKKVWEEMHAAELPPGTSDLRPHWVQRDIGVHVFSVLLPRGMTEAQAFNYLEKNIRGFRPFQRRKNELVLRRPNPRLDPADFIEIRYLFAPECGRLYVMVAWIDSNNERQSLPGLIQALQSTAGSCAK